MTKNRDLLLLEAHQINYRLRSTFFHTKLHEYQTLEFPALIRQLIPHANNFNWNDYKSWGISEHAHHLIINSELKPIQVFCHPRLIREFPKLVAYYRNVAVLSQKATRYLSQINPKKFEDGSKTEIAETQAFKLTQLFNEHVSLIIDSALGKFEEADLHGILFASTGAQIEGAWRNAIGDEAEKAVQRMLTQEVIRRKLFHALIKRDDNTIITLTDTEIEGVLHYIKSFRGIMLTNQKSIIFSSEPDISILDRNGKTLLVIEIKGGTDPAGALERYGAAKKSLEASLKENPTARTYLIASCITEEVEARIQADETISQYTNLTEVITQDEKRQAFLKYIIDIIRE